MPTYCDPAGAIASTHPIDLLGPLGAFPPGELSFDLMITDPARMLT